MYISCYILLISYKPSALAPGRKSHFLTLDGEKISALTNIPRPSSKYPPADPLSLFLISCSYNVMEVL
jgi:hypothetical protein